MPNQPNPFYQIFYDRFSKRQPGKCDPNHLYPLLEHSNLKQPGDNIGTPFVSFKIYHTLDSMPGPTNRKWFPKIYMAITDNGAILEIKPPQLNFSDSLRPILQRIFKERFTALRADIAPISLELIRGSSKDKPKMILTLTPNDFKQFEQILEKTESALLGVCELWREIYHFRMKYREEMRIVAKNAELKIQERATEAVRLRMVSIPE